MTSPETPDLYFDASSPRLVVPDNIAEAVRIERVERRMDFARLRQEIARVSLFAPDSPSEHSYHTFPLPEGSWRVSFESMHCKALGKVYRIITNKEYSDDNDGRYLEIYDYLVSDNANTVAREYTWLHRHHHEHRWAGDQVNYHGPVISMFQGEFTKFIGDNYEPTMPSPLFADFEEVLWRRDDARALIGILSDLNEVTHEAIIN